MIAPLALGWAMSLWIRWFLALPYLIQSYNADLNAECPILMFFTIMKKEANPFIKAIRLEWRTLIVLLKAFPIG